MTATNDNGRRRAATDVVHDLNNLLTVINGYSEMLLSRLDRHDWNRTMVEEVHRAGTQAATLIRQLFGLAASPGTATQPEANMNATSRPAHAPATVLLVEDEDAVRRLLCGLLENDGYRVLDAASGPEALQLCLNETEPIDLLITDVVMPIIGGQELAEMLVQRFANLHVLFVSGYTDEVISRRGVLKDRVTFVQKPFNTGALLRLVREVLDAARGPLAG